MSQSFNLGTSEAQMQWLTTPRCDNCHEPSIVLMRIQYPGEAVRYHCLSCYPLTDTRALAVEQPLVVTPLAAPCVECGLSVGHWSYCSQLGDTQAQL